MSDAELEADVFRAEIASLVKQITFLMRNQAELIEWREIGQAASEGRMTYYDAVLKMRKLLGIEAKPPRAPG